MKRLLFLSIAMCLLMSLNAQVADCPNEATFISARSGMIGNYAARKTGMPSYIDHTSGLTNAPIKKTQKSGNYTPYGYIRSTEYAIPIIGSDAIFSSNNPDSSFYTLFPDSLTISYIYYPNNPTYTDTGIFPVKEALLHPGYRSNWNLPIHSRLLPL